MRNSRNEAVPQFFVSLIEKAKETLKTYALENSMGLDQ